MLQIYIQALAERLNARAAVQREIRAMQSDDTADECVLSHYLANWNVRLVPSSGSERCREHDAQHRAAECGVGDALPSKTGVTILCLNFFRVLSHPTFVASDSSWAALLPSSHWFISRTT